MLEGILGPILGRVAAKVIDEGSDITRAILAARMREVAEELERSDIVSDEAIDGLKSSLDKIRALQGKG